MSRQANTAARRLHYPASATRYAAKGSSAIAMVWTLRNGREAAVIFQGRRSKPTYRYSAANREILGRIVADCFALIGEGEARRAKARAERAAKAAAPHSLAVGDILVCSWGYEQTQIDAYQVIELRGKRTAIICEIATEHEADGWRAKPCAGAIVGEPMRKRIDADNEIKIGDSRGHARKWDGQRSYSVTAPGFGH